MLWILVIIGYSGMIQTPGYTKEECVQQAEWIQKRGMVRDAFCIVAPKTK